jgi:hypothetical protein
MAARHQGLMRGMGIILLGIVFRRLAMAAT